MTAATPGAFARSRRRASGWRRSLAPAVILLAFAASAAAQDNADSSAIAGVFPQGLDQAIYKGVVGSVLDAIPMDPSKRLDLQRTNAVVGNTMLGRSLTVLAGLSNPVLLLGGFFWGLWSASNIKPAEAGNMRVAGKGPSGGGEQTRERAVAVRDSVTAADTSARGVSEPILVSSISAQDADAARGSPAHVIKLWLPQRSSAMLR